MVTTDMSSLSRKMADADVRYKVVDNESIDIDWTPFKFGDHVLTLVVDKTYEGGKTVSSTCEHAVKYVPSPDSSIVLVGVV